ncbi:hypothetical protein A33Q_2048 [Indibacter alkaliphilus LW1]|uniref:DUF4837 domain-containing protein n=1 Tax=Indibacter alkaliphilus (strain CCUG 57479 / KCTC 22604 / LW1) TaxID=1189612 RepID=S2E3H6_INDAL|nr:DUF4837 family protein [Indibacter alkaliphilus]EOZ96738.1 hypothetical protein A33Q_2048 [Indibacter alkaliphilus LW1]
MIVKKIFTALLVGLASIVFWSCEETEESKNSTKPKARGAVGEIILAIDSAKWDGPVGSALKDIFQEDVHGLIRDESMFDIRKVDPRGMNRMLKMATNIVYVTTFDDRKSASQNINALFSKEAKEQAASDPSKYILRSEDEFAVGQEVIYLFGNNEEELVKNLRENKNKLQNLFQVRERNRLERVLLNRKSSAAKVAGRDLGLEVNVPASYQIAKTTDNFLWLRQPTPRADRADISLFFYETDYYSEEQLFPESLLALRESITKMHIYGDPNNRNSYLVTERVDPTPVFTNFSINNNFAIEIRGGWKTNNLSMGGSFMSYVVVDDKNGKLYYMEGFVYYPNEAHREAIREIETLLLATELSPKEDQAS